MFSDFLIHSCNELAGANHILSVFAGKRLTFTTETAKLMKSNASSGKLPLDPDVYSYFHQPKKTKIVRLHLSLVCEIIQ